MKESQELVLAAEQSLI